MSEAPTSKRSAWLPACMVTGVILAVLIVYMPDVRPRTTVPSTFAPTFALTVRDSHDSTNKIISDVVRSPALIALPRGSLDPDTRTGRVSRIAPPLVVPLEAVPFMAQLETAPVGASRNSIDANVQRREVYEDLINGSADGSAGTSKKPGLLSVHLEQGGGLTSATLDVSRLPVSQWKSGSNSWSVTAYLKFGAAGEVREAVVESAVPAGHVPAGVAQALYRCRLTADSATRAGYLTISVCRSDAVSK